MCGNFLFWPHTELTLNWPGRIFAWALRKKWRYLVWKIVRKGSELIKVDNCSLLYLVLIIWKVARQRLSASLWDSLNLHHTLQWSSDLQTGMGHKQLISCNRPLFKDTLIVGASSMSYVFYTTYTKRGAQVSWHIWCTMSHTWCKQV